MWAQMINTAIGIWLMAAPAVLHSSRSAEINDRIVGPVAATFACIAIWQVTRPCRWVNLPLGAWLVIAPFLFGWSGADQLNSIACGVALAALACVRGRITQGFGGGWSALWSARA
jgi:hypothetical protein